MTEEPYKRKKSLWVRDINVEAEVARFLDEYFYSREADDFIRYKDKTEQLKGKDVKLSWGNLKGILIDEKAISHYINKNIPTFAFEISGMFSGKRSEGWLFDEKKETEYYLCIWIWADRSWNPSFEDITKLECLLIKRKDIVNYLEEEGFTKDRICDIETKVRQDMVSGPVDKGKHKYIYFYNTTRLVEKPFNVIIRKEKLKELAVRHFIVTKEGYKEQQ